MTLDDEVRRFEEDGYVFVPGLLNAEETALVLETAKADQVMLGHAMGVADTKGNTSKLSLWNDPGDDVYGMVSRSRRIVDRMERFLGGEVYHYHSKMMLKEPRVGGAWEWHQDYGYWYQNGCLFPYMASCLIALDRAARDNGCLQVLKGSHLLGRIEHGRFGGQTGADPERVKVAMERLELVLCEMAPGTGLFFHGNLLHSSSANTSERPRWSLICCYNAARNDPYKDSHHPRYTPLRKVEEGAILAARGRPTQASAAYLDPKNDKTTVATRASVQGGQGHVQP
jgi:ectoine hydroxylase